MTVANLELCYFENMHISINSMMHEKSFWSTWQLLIWSGNFLLLWNLKVY